MSQARDQYSSSGAWSHLYPLCQKGIKSRQDVMQKHQRQLAEMDDRSRRLDRLCELNVIEQVSNVCQTTIVQQAWERGQRLAIHGWIYGLRNGLVRNLNISVTGQHELAAAYDRGISTRD
ncbi:MAG TPA: carbonic anhydrase [Herpetosiphonaceae bacterium]|nr:carbonic anhydrase [Herpetosiphonaceae bacterium]